MITEINEPIKVGAVFTAGRVTVSWFTWKNRRIPVERVTFTWKTNEGAKDRHCFALSNGAEVFEVSFFPGDLRWYLDKIHLP